MQTKEERILTILRGIAAGNKVVFEDKNGNYSLIKCKGFESREIEGRLQFELYGEYPLSENNGNDYKKNVRPSLFFKQNSKELNELLNGA